MVSVIEFTSAMTSRRIDSASAVCDRPLDSPPRCALTAITLVQKAGSCHQNGS